MANRHLSRSIVLQSLFEWDFRGLNNEGANSVILRNVKEFAPGIEDNSFAKNLFNTIVSKQESLDNIISKAAPDWPIEKISIVDRNILRIGLSELLFSDKSEVPAKVAINEAIELAKSFGGENSGKFINGVLGSVYKELGEPGKDDEPREKKAKAPMPIEILAGAFVYSIKNNEIYVALVHDIFGHWTLSKGHLNPEEEEMKGTARAVGEELGVEISIEDCIGKNEYIASHPEKGKIRKQVVYYLAKTKYQDLTLAKTGGLDDARWFRLREILDLNFYNDILPIVTKGVNTLLGKSKE